VQRNYRSKAASLFMLLAQTFLQGTTGLSVPNASCHDWDANQHMFLEQRKNRSIRDLD